jgi:hypothetical protein
LACASGHAGDWTLTNNISLSADFSDNLDLSSDGDAGVRLRARPRIDLEGEGGRVSGGLSYAPNLYTEFGGNRPQDGINHYLDADFNSELVRNTLFFDARASAGITTTTTANSVGPGDIEYSNDASQVFTLALSPYTQHRLGSSATLLVRLDADWVEGDGSGNIDSFGLAGEARLSSGSRFARAPWSAYARRHELRYDSGTDQRDTVGGSLGYRIDRQWRLDGNLGYEQNKIRTARAETDGMFYSGTVFWTPTPRTELTAELGERYFGPFWNVEGSHKSRRTTLNLAFAREVSNTRADILDNDFVSPLAGPSTQILPVDFVDEDYLTTRLSFDVQGNGRRTNVGAGISWEERSYEVTLKEQQIFRVTADASRRLGSNLNGNLRFSWEDIEDSTTDDSQNYALSLGVSRTLGRESSVGVDVSRRERFSDNSAREYTEHRLSITLSVPMF